MTINLNSRNFSSGWTETNPPITYIDGQFAAGTAFQGSEGSAKSIAKAAGNGIPAGSAEQRVKLWFRIDGAPAGEEVLMVQANANVLTAVDFEVRILSDGRIKFLIVDQSGAKFVQSITSTTYVDNVWYFLDCSGKTGDVDINVDGLEAIYSTQNQAVGLYANVFHDAKVVIGDDGDQSGLDDNNAAIDTIVLEDVFGTAQNALDDYNAELALMNNLTPEEINRAVYYLGSSPRKES